MTIRDTNIVLDIKEVFEIFSWFLLLLWQQCRRKIRVKNKHVQFSTVYKVHRTKVFGVFLNVVH